MFQNRLNTEKLPKKKTEKMNPRGSHGSQFTRAWKRRD